MYDPARIFLLANLALSFYLAGAIWAIEVDIFRSWRLVNAGDFPAVQEAHWRKLRFWVFIPLGLGVDWFDRAARLVSPGGFTKLGDPGKSRMPSFCLICSQHCVGVGGSKVEQGQRRLEQHLPNQDTQNSLD